MYMRLFHRTNRAITAVENLYYGVGKLSTRDVLVVKVETKGISFQSGFWYQRGMELASSNVTWPKRHVISGSSTHSSKKVRPLCFVLQHSYIQYWSLTIRCSFVSYLGLNFLGWILVYYQGYSQCILSSASIGVELKTKNKLTLALSFLIQL